jgi:hypothetical protein
LAAERELARDQRLWDQRKDVYPTILAAIREVAIHARVIGRRLPDPPTDAADREISRQAQIILVNQAKMLAYISEDSSPYWSDCLADVQRLLAVNQIYQRTAADDAAKLPRAVELSRQAVKTQNSCVVLQLVLRLELQGKSPIGISPITRDEEGYAEPPHLVEARNLRGRRPPPTE